MGRGCHQRALRQKQCCGSYLLHKLAVHVTKHLLSIAGVLQAIASAPVKRRLAEARTLESTLSASALTAVLTRSAIPLCVHVSVTRSRCASVLERSHL